MILGALSDVGGRAYLAQQAQKNPTAFMGLVGKILPTSIAGHDGGPVMVITGVIRADDADQIEHETAPPTIEHEQAPAKDGTDVLIITAFFDRGARLR